VKSSLGAATLLLFQQLVGDVEVRVDVLHVVLVVEHFQVGAESVEVVERAAINFAAGSSPSGKEDRE
jgi:hypothetical protein